MRKVLFLLTMMLMSTMMAQTAVRDSVQGRKKVAVVLSGGGAFGAIHVGALKVIVFPAGDTQVGDRVKCRVLSASSATLKGEKL